MVSIEKYRCGSCPKVCPTLGKFNQHLKTHSKPYSCSKCDASFALRSDLNRHDHHRHRLGQSRYPCLVDACSYRATRKDNLKQHMLKHHGEQASTNSIEPIKQQRTTHDVRNTLMHAASVGNTQLLVTSLRLGATLSTKGDDGSTALHCAVKARQYTMMEDLLNMSADTEIQNEKGRTPLQEAVVNRDCQSFKLLIARGAAVTSQVLSNIIRVKMDHMMHISIEYLGDSCVTRFDSSLLKELAIFGSVSMMISIMRCPYFTKEWFDENIYRAARTLILENHWEMLECILNSGHLDPNLHLVKSQRATFLHVAASKGHEETVKVLLRCPGINVHPTDFLGLTPLEKSIDQGNSEITSLLLYHKSSAMQREQGAPLWRRQAKPLHGAIRRGHHAVVQILLKYDPSDLNVVDTRGETPLSIAISTGDSKMLEILLSQPNIAQTNIVSAIGLTPHVYM